MVLSVRALALALPFLLTGEQVATGQPHQTLAVTVRGLVRQELRDGRLVPARSVEVSISSQFTKVGPTVTGSNGFYYFANIKEGTYDLTVLAGSQPTIYQVSITGGPYTELPPVVLRTTLKDWTAAYRNARIAMTVEDWSGALFVLQQIAEQWPETKQNRDHPIPGPTGDNVEAYHLHFYMGVAYFYLGDCKGAVREWKAEQALGSIGTEQRKTVQDLSRKCGRSA